MQETLDVTQKNYMVIEQELLEVVFDLEKFHSYFHCIEEIMNMDHSG